jgi:hypothetical protein
LLFGPRQWGKSTLVETMLGNLDHHYMNGDGADVRETFSNTHHGLLTEKRLIEHRLLYGYEAFSLLMDKLIKSEYILQNPLALVFLNIIQIKDLLTVAKSSLPQLNYN